jgi:hypothetical protein
MVFSDVLRNPSRVEAIGYVAARWTAFPSSGLVPPAADDRDKRRPEAPGE